MKNTEKKKIYFFLGTAAEFTKLAPVFRELKKRNIQFKIISSGQTNLNFKQLEEFTGVKKADIVLYEKFDKSSVFIFFFWAVRALIQGYFILRKEFTGLNKKNVYFIIHGDTVTSSIGAIIAKLYGLKLVHIESGYFSFHFAEPFPEEICKTFNAHFADILFPPTDWAKSNLKKYKKPVVSTKFNTIIESFWWAMNKKLRFPELSSYKNFYIMIMHRQEHVLWKKNWTRDIMEFVIKNADRDLTCIVLSHPLTVEIINSLNLGKKKIKIISGFEYPKFIKFLNKAEFIVTDSATIQQEAYYLGKPFLRLNDYCEQTEGLDQNVVLYQSNNKSVLDFLKNYRRYKRKPIYYEDRPAKIIIDYLLTH